jgi:hypothetical protein
VCWWRGRGIVAFLWELISYRFEEKEGWVSKHTIVPSHYSPPQYSDSSPHSLYVSQHAIHFPSSADFLFQTLEITHTFLKFAAVFVSF